MLLLIVLIILVFIIGGGIWSWPLLAAAFGFSNINDKQSALKNIIRQMITYDIELKDIASALENPEQFDQPHEQQKTDIGKTLFIYLGAIFIFAGVITYIGMFWNSMGSAMRIFVTLGVGYILLVVLISALHEDKFPRLILPLALISVFILTGGWFVFIDEIFPNGDNWRLASLFVFGVMAAQQCILFAKYRLTVFAFTSLVFGYGALHFAMDLVGIPVPIIAIALGASLLLISVAIEKTAHRVLVEPLLFVGIFWFNAGLLDRITYFTHGDWAHVVVGTCVIFTAYGLQKEDRYPRLIALSYFTGSIMLYAGLFSLVKDSYFELLYIAVCAMLLYACVALKSRALLITTTLAMLSFIGYYSAQHFANSLGWPITLVLMGIGFLGIGTLAIKVKRKMV